MRIHHSILLLTVLFTSCMVGPDFKTPGNDLPGSWATSPPPASDKNNIRKWWTVFGDKQLDRLLGDALNNSPDMRMAIMRVWEARSSAKIAGAALLPSSSADFGSGRSSDGGLTKSSSSNFSLGADISWDLDIFGGNRRQLESSLANLMSTEANAISVRTLLLANIATTYFDWMAANEQLRVAEEQLALQRRTLNIVEQQYPDYAARLDLEQARAQVASTEASIPSIKASIETHRNSLSVYLGTYMSRTKLTMPSASVHEKLPMIPTGLPSDLLRRRPDVIGAEADLHAAVADIGVAVADLYPKFSLTGSLSSGGGSFKDVFMNHSAGWSLGGRLTQPLYQGGSLRERVKQQEVVAERMAEQYRKILITAVSEVESALITYGSSVERLAKMEVQNKANREVYDLSMKSWQAGQIEFINVISAQQSLLSSEESIVTLKQTIRKSVVQLALALGGGW